MSFTLLASFFDVCGSKIHFFLHVLCFFAFFLWKLDNVNELLCSLFEQVKGNVGVVKVSLLDLGLVLCS